MEDILWGLGVVAKMKFKIIKKREVDNWLSNFIGFSFFGFLPAAFASFALCFAYFIYVNGEYQIDSWDYLVITFFTTLISLAALYAYISEDTELVTDEEIVDIEKIKEKKK